MIRRVGPLLWVGLGLCAASGCALSAPSRTSGPGEQISLRDESAARSIPSARSKSASDGVEVRETRSPREAASRGVVAHRSQKAVETTLHESPLDDRGLQHEPVLVPGLSRREIRVTADDATTRHDELSVRGLEPGRLTRAQRDDSGATLLFGGHSSDQPVGETDSGARSPITQAVAWTEEQRPDQLADSGLRTANYRSDQDASDNPVELQGFEVIAPSDSAPSKSGFSGSRTSNEQDVISPWDAGMATATPNQPPPWSSRPGTGSTVQSSPSLEYGGALPSREASNTAGGFRSPPLGEVLREPTRDTHGPALRGPAPRVQSVSSQAAPPLPPSPWQSEVNQLIARVEGELKDMSPGSSVAAQAEYRRRQVHLRLLYLVAQRPEQALMAISGLEASEQEYWQQLCWAASNSLDAEQFPLPRDRATQSIAPLNTALRRLREQADLSIKNTAFCEQISYFGNYQKFARDEFTPGQEVLLYAEIENFNTEQTADGEHRTLLRSVIDIIGANGQTRWHKTFAATEDRCRNPRRDYFHNYQFTIPDRLPLGPHTLKLTVVDDLSGKQASYSLRFLVK